MDIKIKISIRHISIKMILCYLVLAMACSCQNSRFKTKYLNFVRHEINLPDSLTEVMNGEVFPYYLDGSRPKLIIYNDSTACSSCRINHLPEYDKLFHLAEDSGLFDVVILFCPKPEEYDKVIRDIRLSASDHSVFVDREGSFARLNQHIPSDERFHVFLLNKDRLPAFVGNPLDSDRLWEIFTKTILNQ